jgi:hypothetical protein
VIVSDTLDKLRRLDDILYQLETAPIDVWLLQGYILTQNQTTDITAALDGSASLTLTDTEHAWSLAAALDARLNHQKVKTIATPLALLTDGNTATLNTGQKIPLMKRAVSPEGTVQTIGFEYLTTGLTWTTTLREAGPNQALLDLKLELSTIDGFTEDTPYLTQRSFASNTLLTNGGTYLLGLLTQTNKTTNTALLNILPSHSRNKSTGTLEIWVQAFKIAGPTKLEIPFPALTSRDTNESVVSNLRLFSPVSSDEAGAARPSAGPPPPSSPLTHGTPPTNDLPLTLHDESANSGDDNVH